MPSTNSSVRTMRSRYPAGHGANEKPQLPEATLVTP